jgi:hypothetical protein
MPSDLAIIYPLAAVTFSVVLAVSLWELKQINAVRKDKHRSALAVNKRGQQRET